MPGNGDGIRASYTVARLDSVPGVSAHTLTLAALSLRLYTASACPDSTKCMTSSGSAPGRHFFRPPHAGHLALERFCRLLWHNWHVGYDASHRQCQNPRDKEVGRENHRCERHYV